MNECLVTSELVYAPPERWFMACPPASPDEVGEKASVILTGETAFCWKAVQILKGYDEHLAERKANLIALASRMFGRTKKGERE